MEDYASEGILKLARGRARWFWIPIAGWSLLTFTALRYPIVAVVFASIAAMFTVFWYFASQGREWPFLVGAILAGLNAIVGILSVYGFVGGLVAAFVAWRLWDSFITCCSLASTKSLHAQLVDRLVIPSRIANTGPRNVFKPDLPRRVAEESEAPAPSAWQPYRPPTTIDGPPEATA